MEQTAPASAPDGPAAVVVLFDIDGTLLTTAGAGPSRRPRRPPGGAHRAPHRERRAGGAAQARAVRDHRLLRLLLELLRQRRRRPLPPAGDRPGAGATRPRTGLRGATARAGGRQRARRAVRPLGRGAVG